LLALEDRALMASLAQIPNLNSPVGLGFQVPLDGGTGQSQTYTAQSDNPDIVVTPATGQFWSVTVTHQSSGPDDPSFTGTLVFQLFGDLTPDTVAKISQLVESGFYTSPTQPPAGSSVAQLPNKNFHRIVPGFVAQAGSQSGNGSGSLDAPGFPFPDEFRQQLVFNGFGQLAMANAGDDTNDSQFFVTYGPQRNLDFNHTIFGQLVSGQETLGLMQNVAKTATSAGGEVSQPVNPVLITGSTLSDTNPDGVLHIDTTRATQGETANVVVTATAADGSKITRTFQVTATPNVDANGQPINEPAFLNPLDNVVVAQGQTAVFLATATNPEPTDTLSYVVAGGVTTSSTGTKSFQPVTNATASVDTNGVVTVVPNAGFTGVINLLIGVRDQVARSGRGTSLSSPDAYDTQMITLTVRNGEVVNLPPIAVPATQDVPANQASTVQLQGLTANPASTTQTLTYALLQGPQHGTLTDFDPATGTFQYTPNPDYVGTDTVQYRVTENGDPGPSLTSQPSTFTLNVTGSDTGAVRVVDGVLIITPPPRTDGGTNSIQVTQFGSNIRVKVNNLIDTNQPAVSSIDRIMIYGAKASDQVFVDPALTQPTWISGGLGGHNRLQAGGGPSILQGWYGLNRLSGGPGDDVLTGRTGHVAFRVSGGQDIYFAGQARPGRRGGGMYSPSFKFSAVPKPPTGTFYRAVNDRLVPVATPALLVNRNLHPLVGAGHDNRPQPPTPGLPASSFGGGTGGTGTSNTPITIPGLDG
jgi:cyclophilin family peptidyl-prolyl cis-trans isomerase